MKMSEYPTTTSFDDSSILIADGTAGTRKIYAKDAILAMLDANSVHNHRLVFRGKNLGTSLTIDQKTAIQNGSFSDLWLGDYWVIGGVTWRIVDFNYWMGSGDTELITPHIVVMPDSNLGTGAMNASATTTGGYTGSAMYTTNMSSAKTLVTSAFGDAVLTHREYLINAVTSGYASGGAWTDSGVDLPNELMIYGSHIYAAAGDGTTNVKRYTNSATQLALFRVAPRFINKPDGASARISYWLRDIVNASSFVRVSSYGAPQDTSASQSYGIRPVFAIG